MNVLSNIIHTQIKQRLEVIPTGEDTLIVLKGIPLSYFDEPKISIDQMIDNKMMYFMRMVQEKRRYVLYEEYLCLYAFIEQQYKHIHILDNNLYINLYVKNANIEKIIIDITELNKFKFTNKIIMKLMIKIDVNL